MRFGSQVDIKGIDGGSPEADRAVRYLTKYLTKAVTETYTDPSREQVDAGYEAHIDRMHDELRFQPCSPECANWLRYGGGGPRASHGCLPACPGARPRPATASTPRLRYAPRRSSREASSGWMSPYTWASLSLHFPRPIVAVPAARAPKGHGRQDWFSPGINWNHLDPPPRRIRVPIRSGQG